MNQYVVCRLEDILPETGVCALIEGKQVAIFRTKDNKLFALDNYDPFSQANVLSRGLVGGTTVTNDGGIDEAVLYVASPIYKQRFNIATGQCLDDNSVMLDMGDLGATAVIPCEQSEAFDLLNEIEIHTVAVA